MNWKFWKRKEKSEPQYPWWMYCTFTEMRHSPEFDATKILDEFTEIMEKESWTTYGGLEALACLLLMERKKSKENGS